MAFRFTVNDAAGSWPAGQRRSVEVGGNGSQGTLCGLFFAAYAAARRPHAGRVCGWVNSYPPGPGRVPPPGAPRTQPGRPATAAALLAFNHVVDGYPATTVSVWERRLRHGLAAHPLRDPDLVALVEWWDVIWGAYDVADAVEVDLVVRVAPVLEALVPQLAVSCWHDTCREVAELFAAAAAARVPVAFA